MIATSLSAPSLNIPRLIDHGMTSLRLIDLIDAVIVFTVIEALALLIHHRVTGRGVPGSQFLVNLVSGLCLMLALRSALGSEGDWVVAAWLGAAGLAHAADLRRRWRR